MKWIALEPNGGFGMDRAGDGGRAVQPQSPRSQPRVSAGAAAPASATAASTGPATPAARAAGSSAARRPRFSGEGGAVATSKRTSGHESITFLKLNTKP